MKKTILATLVAASAVVSFSSSASYTLPTPDQKIDALEQILESKGATISTNPSGTLKTVSVIRDGELHTVTLDTVSGHYMYNGETVKIDRTHLDTIKEKGTEVVHEWLPKNDPITPTNSEKAEVANEMFDKMGMSATIQQSADGNFRLIHSNGEVVELSGMTDEQIVVLKNAAKVAIKEDQMSNPISPINPSNDEKIAMVNEKFEKLGVSAEVVRDKNGNVQFEFTSGVNGEKRTVNLSDMTEEQIAELKDITTGEIKKELVGVDPIDPGFGVDPITDNDEKKDELKRKIADAGENLSDAGKATKAKLSAIYKTQAQTDSRQDQSIATNAAGIKENKQAITFLNSEIDRLDSKIDGVMAGVHAVNNARPYLNAEGQTAVGAGVGFAGSNSAVAVGVAHAYTESWSFSATMNVTTGDSSELSGGVGTQYTF